MKKKGLKKLSLNRETLQMLAGYRLAEALGGVVVPPHTQPRTACGTHSDPPVVTCHITETACLSYCLVC
jgi:hypothetical protein